MRAGSVRCSTNSQMSSCATHFAPQTMKRKSEKVTCARCARALINWDDYSRRPLLSPPRKSFLAKPPPANVDCGFKSQQAAHDCEARYDAWLRKLKPVGESLGTLKILG